MVPSPTRRPERDADADFRSALFRASRHPLERLPGVDAASAEALLRHQFIGQEASYRASYPAARREIVEVAGTPVGRLVVDEGAEAWTLVDVALLPDWRGRGIGTRILGEVMAGARAAGRPLRLSVMAHNDGAVRLYRRLGFAIAVAAPPVLAMRWAAPPGGAA